MKNRAGDEMSLEIFCLTPVLKQFQSCLRVQWNILPIVIAIAVGPAALADPSFDCSKNLTNIERVVCSDTLLPALDSALAQRFTDLKRRLSENDVGVLVKDQRHWIKKRDGNCEKRENISACLVDEYENRLDEIRLWTEKDARGRLINKKEYASSASRDKDLCTVIQKFYKKFGNKIDLYRASGRPSDIYVDWLFENEINYVGDDWIPVKWKEEKKQGEGRAHRTMAIEFDLFHEGSKRIISVIPKWGPHSESEVGAVIRILKEGSAFTFVPVAPMRVDVDPDLVDLVFDPEVAEIKANPGGALELIQHNTRWPPPNPYSVYMIDYYGEGYFVLQLLGKPRPLAEVVHIDKDGATTDVCSIK